MGFWKVILDFGRKCFDRASIAVSAYAIGDAQNDSEKVQKAVIEAAKIMSKEASTENAKDISLITYMIMCLIVIVFIVAGILISKCCTKRAVSSERQVIWSELKAKLSSDKENE